MQDRKLEQVLDVYFQDEPDKGSKEFQEAQKYLKLRIRPAMEFLIEKEDTDRMEQLEKCGWFSIKELETFIRCAQEKTRLRSLVWLLHLKNEKYGYGHILSCRSGNVNTKNCCNIRFSMLKYNFVQTKMILKYVFALRKCAKWRN